MELNIEQRVVDVTVYDDGVNESVIVGATLEFLVWEDNKDNALLKRMGVVLPEPTEEFKTYEQVTNDDIKTWVMSACNVQINEFLSNIAKEFKVMKGNKRVIART